MNGHGAKNGRKGNRDILEFKISRRPSEGRVGSQGCENARIFKLG